MPSTALTEDMRNLFNLHREEIERDLTETTVALDRYRGEVRALEHRLSWLITLVDFGAETPETPDSQLDRLTLHLAMVKVLSEANTRMRAADVAAEITRQGLYKMRDGRPVEAQQIHARVGNYPDLFERDGVYIRVKQA